MDGPERTSTVVESVLESTHFTAQQDTLWRANNGIVHYDLEINFGSRGIFHLDIHHWPGNYHTNVAYYSTTKENVGRFARSLRCDSL